MKITKSKYLGYCVGVKNAIKKAVSIKEEHPDQDVFLYGELVHNLDTIEYLKKKELKFIPDKKEELEKLSSDSIVIFSAHGHKKEDEQLLKSKGIEFYDLTCSVIKNITKIINADIKVGQKIAYIGKKGHKEAEAVLSMSDKIQFIDYKEPNANINLSLKNTNLYCQSSLSKFQVEKIISDLKLDHDYEGFKFINTLCPNISERQEEIKNLDEEYDLVLIVGDPLSSNANELYETAFKNKKIKRALLAPLANLVDFCGDFDGIESVFIASATSTNIDDVDKAIEILF